MKLVELATSINRVETGISTLEVGVDFDTPRLPGEEISHPINEIKRKIHNTALPPPEYTALFRAKPLLYFLKLRIGGRHSSLGQGVGAVATVLTPVFGTARIVAWWDVESQ